MTAIIAYYEKNTQRAIICCDNIAKAESRYDINDKCFCLFNRFYIAVWGPHLLVDAVHITKDVTA